MTTAPSAANKTDSGNGSYGVGRVADAAAVDALVEREIERIEPPDLRALAESHRVPPYVEERSWDYGDDGQTYPCWIVGGHPASDTAIAYCSEGFGPAYPWGLLFRTGPRNLGQDSQWFASLEDALRNSPAWRGANPPDYEVP